MKESFKKRFLFVPVVCTAMLYMIITYRLVSATGVLNIDFAEIDSRLIKPNKAEVSEIYSKNLLMPKTQNAGRGYIDINNASIEELDTLPGVGEKRATAIAEQRRKMGGFSTLRDTVCTEGIGIETFENIEPYIKISEYNGK